MTLSRHNVTHVIRNPFSEQKMVYNAENGTVIYRSRMHAKTKRNFEIFSAEKFIAAITQHIPDPAAAGLPGGPILRMVQQSRQGRAGQARGRARHTGGHGRGRD